MSEAKPRLVWVAEHDDDSDYLSVMERLDTQGIYEGVTVCRLHDEAAADLIADAGTVFNTTGLTPSQLVEQRDQLVERVKDLEEALTLADLLLSGANMNRANVELKVRAALSKARPNTAEGEAHADSVLEDAVRWFSERDNVLHSFWVLLREAETQADNDNNPLLKHQVEGFYRQWNALNGSAIEPHWVTRAARTPAAAKEPSP